jgi:hypothetical protein
VRCPRSEQVTKAKGLSGLSLIFCVGAEIIESHEGEEPYGRQETVNWALEQGPVAGSEPRPALKWYSGATPRELVETSAERIVLE